MRKYTILFILLLIIHLAFGQESQPAKETVANSGIWVEAGGAWSMPIGSYSGTDIESDKSGFAEPGYAILVSGSWIGAKSFGIFGRYMFQRNTMNSASEKKYMSGDIGPLGPGNWTNHYLMVGPEFLHHFGRFVFIDVKAAIGLILSSNPVYRTEDPVTLFVSNNTATGFAFGINAGVGYTFAGRFSVKLDVGYLTAAPGISKQYLETLTDSNGYQHITPNEIDTKRTVSSFNLGAGVSYRFGK